MFNGARGSTIDIVDVSLCAGRRDAAKTLISLRFLPWHAGRDRGNAGRDLGQPVPRAWMPALGLDPPPICRE